MSSFNPYKTLGIRCDAGAKRIKKAFRDAAKRTHPDTGGKVEEFQMVRRAYFILQDPQRKKKYDTTGEIDETTALSFEGQVAGVLVALFEHTIRSGKAFKRDLDLIDAMSQELGAKIQQAQDARSQNDELIPPLAALKRRISRGEGENIFAKTLDRRIDQLNENTAQMNEQTAVLKAAFNELESYDCVVEMVQHHYIFSQASAAMNTSTSTF